MGEIDPSDQTCGVQIGVGGRMKSADPLRRKGAAGSRRSSATGGAAGVGIGLGSSSSSSSDSKSDSTCCVIL